MKNDSFFNFFDPPPLPEDPEAEVDAETQELLTADFEIGHYIRERIIPRAVLFFTGNYSIFLEVNVYYDECLYGYSDTSYMKLLDSTAGLNMLWVRINNSSILTKNIYALIII